MEIRPVDSIEEFRDAMAVNRAAWRDAYDDILPAEVLDGLDVPEGDALRELYADACAEGQHFLVALDGGPDTGRGDSGATDVVGFAQFVHHPRLSKPFVGDEETGLRALYVEPDEQGEGVGSELLGSGFDRLPSDTDAVALEVFRENDDVREFYESRGFDRRGENSFEVGEEQYPTVVYEKPV
ncbi:GNAT family N-acetyltransferase [Halorarum halophilum]|uniref:GNAT family N-acetyltransferase n=1 Tax=Halorarum halophilum TaxID=2743090 RepID=A0A7D5K8K4_9EURY|nr:GNAT family N-acetyltransferase [Halobaculum halophilum]QLG28339.1 GNAT family N-acetyltransferase [Halobaculum halophilum]